MKNSEKKSVKGVWGLAKICLVLLTFFCLQITLGSVAILSIGNREIEKKLDFLVERVGDDLSYENGKWDTSRYNSDPLTAYPNSSSSHPLYIMTSDGFVIERSQPISGFLDTSDHKHLLAFNQPQVIDTITNEKWLVLSKPILADDGKLLGAMMVASYDPTEKTMEEDKSRLYASVGELAALVKTQDGKIDVKAVDARKVHFSVSFEIVDVFNKVLINDGRVPTYIDPSYVAEAINNHSKVTITDSSSNEKFRVSVRPIVDKTGLKVGVVAAGNSITQLNTLLLFYLAASVVTDLIFSIPLTLVVVHFANKMQVESDQLEKLLEPVNQIKRISFDSGDCELAVDDKSYKLVFDSNQYYICKAMFRRPTKKWGQDELQEILGDEIGEMGRSRKIYDAVLAINQKIGLKLIVYRDKTYFINPDVVELIG